MKKRNIFKYFILILIISSILSLIGYSLHSYNDTFITTKKKNIIGIYKEIALKQKNSDYDAYLSIPNLNIYRGLYIKNKKKNNVEKEVMVLETSDFSTGNIVLAAHSGNNYNAYFNNLDELDENTNIYVIYKKHIYTYKLISHKEVKKTGYVYLKTYPYPVIVLITCNKNNNKTQIIYTAKLENKKEIKTSSN